jgi:alpha-beta hydrolase superfamily lysophospholipase
MLASLSACAAPPYEHDKVWPKERVERRPWLPEPALTAPTETAMALNPEGPIGGSFHGVIWFDARFKANDGTALFAQTWQPVRATPTAVLVIVHGLKDHSTRYGPLAVQLSKRGISTYAFDLRGHGRSEGDRVWVEKFDDYLDDLDAFLKIVRAAEPGKPIFLMGHSMGGAIVTLDVLDRHPDVAGLILSAPAIQLDVSALKSGPARFLGSAVPTLALMSLDDDLFSRDPASVKAMHEDPLVYDDNGPARTIRELFRAMDRIDEKAEQLVCPLLVLHGTADQITDPRGSEALVKRAGSKDKTLELYEGFYHDLLHEPAKDRKRVAADIEAWLVARLPAPRARAVQPLAK